LAKDRKMTPANPCSDVRLSCEKSAEVIVPVETGKDRTTVVFRTRGR